ncbi:MAG: MCE family protein [Planctomycetaceae bacterium]|nr:MCE family protein [Planctomycetaceae bacterium]
MVAFALIGAMVFQFGELSSFWQKSYQLAVHFESVPGVHAGSPVRMSGLTIGEVRELALDETRGGVGVIIDIQERFQLRADAKAMLATSLLGDSVIEFTPGTKTQRLEPGTLLEGQMPLDPLAIVNRLDSKFSTTMASFEQTSAEWRKVGENINGLMDTNRGNLNVVIERAAIALDEFTITMQEAKRTVQSTNKVFADPKTQESLRQTLAALPELANETRQTITLARRTLESAQKNFDNLQDVTDPLAKSAGPIMAKLDRTLTNLDTLSSELAVLSKLAAKEDGSLRKLASDPELYRNLNRSAESLSILLNNLEPIVRDAHIFTDKVARHPELLGVSGAIRGSSGVKDAGEVEPRRLRSDETNSAAPATSKRASDKPNFAIPKMLK